jgi:hypothetical protein
MIRQTLLDRPIKGVLKVQQYTPGLHLFLQADRVSYSGRIFAGRERRFALQKATTGNNYSAPSV